jgi:hypothetical protein
MIDQVNIGLQLDGRDFRIWICLDDLALQVPNGV